MYKNGYLLALQCPSAFSFALGDGREIDLIDHGFVVRDDLFRDVHPEASLRSQHGQPEFPLEHDLVLSGPSSLISTLA